ncbi:MAG: monofunctional biosynthetic peptidoglycan transglycosylase [Pseudomonadota bacterium]
MAQRKRHRSRKRQWLYRISAIVAGLFLVSLMLVVPLRWFDPVTTAFMLQDGSGLDPVLYQWADRTDIGVAPALAVVAAEDQKFADHFGFDVQSIVDSIEDFEDGKSLRGASTISQQVAKNLYLWSGRSYVRKGLEAYFTVLIEISLPKERILEIYLNIAEFGPGVYGVPAASRYYFNKDPLRMSNSEAALLAAVLPNPNRLHVDRPSRYVRERQRWIREQMERLHREQWIVALE